jgi:formaldehyde-activating enzyme involved in methanogenesis
MLRRDTVAGFITLRDVCALRPKTIEPHATVVAQIKAKSLSGECQSAIASTAALQALASIMPREWPNTTEICSARMFPATASSVAGPPNGDRSPANSFEK